MGENRLILNLGLFITLLTCSRSASQPANPLRYTTVSSRWSTTVVEIAAAGDIQTFIRDIETGIDAIDDFPKEVEPPVIQELGKTDPVLSVLVSGPMDLPDLKAYCEDFKDRLQEAGVALVTIQGFSDHQLRISLSDAALRKTGLTAARGGGPLRSACGAGTWTG
jgi:multidrug efflux pump subunit AcrB